MRTVPMCLSILQVPRCRIHTLANFCWESFHSLSSNRGNRSSFKLFGSRNYGFEEGNNKRWTRRPVTTKTEGKSKKPSSKASNIRHEIFEETVAASNWLNVNKTEITEISDIQLCSIQQKISESKDLASLVTVIVFDIETTGLSRENERIIEIALQDLTGGENSTFQTFVNPERYVPNSHVHGITTHMVCRHDVPRMKELIPILVQYVTSRQKPGGYILWVAHNGRCFDVPFLSKEFSRCGFEVPSNWLYVDTLPLAREMMKSKGIKLSSISLQALREYYGIPLVGSAHRAMSDVNSLALILQKLTFDLKLPISGLFERHFKVSDSTNSKKKKKN